ncbi:MAG: glycosyltransferase family 9 protein [Dehalococcoidia bacterium]
MKKPRWVGNERVVVFRTEDIAQLVMATPALRAIREALPDGQITLLTSHTAAGLAPCLEGVDEVIPFTTLWADRRGELAFDPEREEGFVEELRGGKYAAAIILNNQTQSSLPAAYACYMAGIPLRLARSAEVAGSLLTHRVRGFGEGHEIERCLEVVGTWGFDTSDKAPSLVTPPKVRATVDLLLKNHGVAGRPYVVVHGSPEAGRSDATIKAFARAITELADRFGYLTLMTGLPDERLAIQWVAGEAGTPSLVIAGETSVAELATVIEGAAIVVAANASPAHIASAYGVPSMLICEGTRPPAQWLPWGRSVAVDAGDATLGEQLTELLGVGGGAALAPAAAV